MGESSSVIECPYCGREIALDQALSQRIRQELQQQVDAEFTEKRNQLRQAELGIEAEKRRIAEERKGLEAEAAKRVSEERGKLKAEVEKELQDKASAEMTALKQQLEAQEKKITAFRETEIRLRGERTELEEAKKGLELEVVRQIDAERKRIQEEAEKKLGEQYRMKDAEKDKMIEDLRRQAEELKRKAEQGSQQLQGEVAELSLEEMLRTSFPSDSIEEVPKGIRGADVVHRVCTNTGQSCGTLIWESKRTKAWSESWIDKLKEDQREIKADIAVLVSATLPRAVNGFARINGVWVCDHSLAVCLAHALRIGLVDIAAARLSATGKSEKMELLYEYLTGPEFRQQVEGIVEAFAGMQRDLEQEKRATEKIWAKRQKQIERVIKNMGRMYGSMQGIIGQSIPEIDLLELKALSEGTDGEDPGKNELL
jgi:hypothetical protein